MGPGFRCLVSKKTQIFPYSCFCDRLTLDSTLQLIFIFFICGFYLRSKLEKNRKESWALLYESSWLMEGRYTNVKPLLQRIIIRQSRDWSWNFVFYHWPHLYKWFAFLPYFLNVVLPFTCPIILVIVTRISGFFLLKIFLPVTSDFIPVFGTKICFFFECLVTVNTCGRLCNFLLFPLKLFLRYTSGWHFLVFLKRGI